MASAASRLKPHHLRLFFSNKYAYAQVFRIADNNVVAAASTIEKGLQDGLQSLSDKQAAAKVGAVVGQRLQKAGVTTVHWPRPRGKRYHGRIASMLEALKAEGVKLA